MPSHLADKPAPRRRSAAAATTPQAGDGTPGRSRGGAHARPRSRRRLGSLPVALGATALTLATVGTLTIGASEAGSSPLGGHPIVRQFALPSAATGVSSTTRQALSGRERAVSRDSQRAALQDAAEEDLQAVAEKQARERNAALAQLAASAEKQAGLMARDAWQLPVAHGAYHLTSRFGQCSALWSHCHTGLDFAGPTGTPIHAVASGTITELGSAGAYGNRTIETLEDGTEVWYCHQSAFAAKVGQKVAAGQVIGAIGATGNTTGPHLHLEVRPGAGDPVDPFAALVAHGLKP